MAIQAGELNRQVALQRKTTTPTSNGERTPTWTTFATTWMGLKSVSGQEQERGKGTTATQTHRAKMRYRPDVDVQCRVQYKGRNFLINSVLNIDEMNAELNLDLTEVVGQ